MSVKYICPEDKEQAKFIYIKPNGDISYQNLLYTQY